MGPIANVASVSIREMLRTNCVRDRNKRRGWFSPFRGGTRDALKNDRRSMFTRLSRQLKPPPEKPASANSPRHYPLHRTHTISSVARCPGIEANQYSLAGWLLLHSLRMQPRFRYATRYRSRPGDRNSTLSSIRAPRKGHLFKKAVWITA